MGCNVSWSINMNKVIRIFICFSLLMMVACSEEEKILSTKYVAVIENETQNADKNTLVIFDVTDVLFEQSGRLFKAKNSNQLDQILGSFVNRVSKQEKENVFSIIIQQPVVPVDTKLVGIINNLQSRGVKVMALTNGLTGEYGQIKSMENLLIQQLTGLNYHFEMSWLSIKNTTLNLAKDQNILFKDGVVFTSVLTSKASKGDSILAFLKYAQIQPKKVIFVDDKQKNLKSVAEAMKKNGIKFVGIEYTASRDRDMEPVSEKHAELQMSILEKEHKLLPDEEIQKMLSTNN